LKDKIVKIFNFKNLPKKKIAIKKMRIKFNKKKLIDDEIVKIKI
jgi:hypothetical protein